MITGQDEEAARKWEEYQKRNRPAAREGQQKERVAARIGLVLGAGASRAVSYSDDAEILSPLDADF
jgi:hypothetical protein